MGVVYRAEDMTLGRMVALKFMLPDYTVDDSPAARFLREARSVAALDHPNICTVYEAGKTEEGQLFRAMSLLPGRDAQGSPNKSWRDADRRRARHRRSDGAWTGLPAT
jgi:serine/threonine-protein kinase